MAEEILIPGTGTGSRPLKHAFWSAWRQHGQRLGGAPDGSGPALFASKGLGI
jgi:hypothetical protein